MKKIIEINWFDFCYLSGSLPHKHKIVIAGNHELSFDTRFTGDDKVTSKHSNHKSAHTGMIYYFVFFENLILDLTLKWIS